MVTLNQIEELGRRIGREFHAERVVLFGSNAGGAPTDDSHPFLGGMPAFLAGMMKRSSHMAGSRRPCHLSGA